MDKNTLGSESASAAKLALRQLAEGMVQAKVVLSKERVEAMSPAAMRELLHELQVHQIELEMQNETLRQTQLQLVAMQARYFDLYDLAPISYCTVNEQGIILEANLATAELLGEARNSLVGQRISRYIGKEWQDAYYLCRKLLLSTGERQSCELHMAKGDGTAVWVKAFITSAEGNDGDTVQRMVLTDISDAKIMSLAMRESESKLRAIVDSHA